MRTPKPTLADALKSARERRRLTQAELAAASKVSASAISRIELGQRTRCRADLLNALAKVLKIPVGELIEPPAAKRQRGRRAA